jgi:uncharacterized protein
MRRFGLADGRPVSTLRSVFEVLVERPPWYLAGAAIGMTIVATLALLNRRLGVAGGYAEIVERVRVGSFSFGWQAWFVFGIVGGGVLFSVLSGQWLGTAAYGWLSDHGDFATAAILLGAGTFIGFGAKTARGCTSGHGMSGSAFASPASIVAAMTFTGTAIATAFAAKLVLG